MNRLLPRLAFALAAGACAQVAAAVDLPQVQAALDKNGCQGCHGLNNNVNGPSYHEIAARYINKPDVRSYLSDKIRNGSSNTWGAAAMPPTETIDDLDLKMVVEWLATGASAPAAPAPAQQ